ncbi:MAG: hypothetical protein GX309_07425 [Clostridiales bacterium]|jgi:hypothetical protein|nr:hypothetical protein [Clostridiales bacterium]
MSKFEERENRRKSVVKDIVDVQGEEKQEKRDIIARTFYIGTEHVKALAFEKAETGKDLSEIVREALDDYFGEKINNYK